MLYDPKRWDVPVKAPPVDTWRQHLLNAADVIEQRGHTQWKLCDIASGAVCLVGAINIAVHGSHGHSYDQVNFNLAQAPLMAVSRYLSRVGAWAFNPVGWNNAPGRTQAEVVSALRGAAEMAD